MSDFAIEKLGSAEQPFRHEIRYDSRMYSDAVLDHFRNPRNAGKLPEANVHVEASNPVCGDLLELAARIESGRIAEIRFLCRGCTTSIACASLLTEQLRGSTLSGARTITAETISKALGGLPPATFHGAQLAAEALALLLAKVA
ncbi:MAG TPA: iron-sulfur cluster assembly scaffold protein [Candidatus Acidoferrum sp.]|nr:iron-sulfur cluster assembly scaffold protein [Candidatus Acidoferrum sp.]